MQRRTMNNIQQFVKELTILSREHGLFLEANIYEEVCITQIPPERQFSDFGYVVKENGDGLEWLTEEPKEMPVKAGKPLNPPSLRSEQLPRTREARMKQALDLLTDP
jgi:hypothetical protein